MTDTETESTDLPKGAAALGAAASGAAHDSTPVVVADAVAADAVVGDAVVEVPEAEGADREAADLDTADEDTADSGAADSGAAPLRGARLLEREGDLAADYLETLLDIADLDGDIDMDIDGERATVDVVGENLGRLVGSAGETLDALQELTRLAVQRETGVRSRLMLDIGGFRAGRRTQLRQVALDTAAEVSRTGVDKALSPMTPFERKVVHDAIGGADGVRSESEGEEPHRFVVVRPS